MLRIGVAGWDYPDWEGVVYPAPQPRGFDRLAFLSRYLDVLEINTTFYRQPDARAARSWADRVEAHPRFRFTAKLYRDLTHRDRPPAGAAADDGDAERMRAEADRYRAGIQPLLDAGRLGAILAQFPQRFHDRDAARAHVALLAEVLAGLPLVCEFRHRSWDHEDALRFLHGLGIGFCNVDQPRLRQTLPPTGHVTAPVAYVRLHGRNAESWFREGGPPHARYDYLYAADELRPWSERIGRMEERAEEVFVIANNHYRGKGPANALMLKAMTAGARVAAPAALAEAYAELAALATPDAEPDPAPAQGRLF